MAGRKFFIPLRWRAVVSERSWNTILQILSEEEVAQLKILYEELRKQIPKQDYRLIKTAIKKEKNKNKNDREILSVLDFFESIKKERREGGEKRRNKTKNIKKRKQKREKVK